MEAFLNINLLVLLSSGTSKNGDFFSAFISSGVLLLSINSA